MWWLIIFSLSLCPVCKAPFHFRQQLDAKTVTSIFQGSDDVSWYAQWVLIRCDKCNNAFYAQADTILRYSEQYRLIDTTGEIRKFYYKQDTLAVTNPRWAKKEKTK